MEGLLHLGERVTCRPVARHAKSSHDGERGETEIAFPGRHLTVEVEAKSVVGPGREANLLSQEGRAEQNDAEGD